MSVDVEIRLKLLDNAKAGIKGASQAAQQEAVKTASATERAANKAAEAAQKSAEKQRSSYQGLAHAREVLGVRSETAIQREIQRTEAAYERLKASGLLSMREQTMAAGKMREKVAELNREMGKLTASQKAAAGFKFAAAGIAGVAAAAYTLKAPAEKAMAFDERLAYMANTAYAERDSSGRKIGMKQLEEAINKSVGKGGGGTRDQAAGALETLIDSNSVSASDAMAMLPQIMRYSVASQTDAGELAQMSVRAMQTYKLKPADLPNIMNMGIAAGEAGGMKMKDMARFMPQQMAAASMAGMSGRAGYAKLLALNEVAAKNAASTDDAGSGVAGLLTAITSKKTAMEAKQMGVNLSGYLQKQNAKGVDSVDAFAALVDKNLSRRRDYQELQKQLKSATTNEGRQAALENMSNIATSTGVGSLIKDRGAAMALMAMMNNRDYMREVQARVTAGDVAQGGAGDKNYELLSDTSGFKLQQAGQQKDINEKAAMDELTPAIGKAADAFADLSAKHPLLAGAVTLSTTALTAFSGVVGLASVVMGKMSGGSATGAIGAAGDMLRDGALSKGGAVKLLGQAAGIGAAWDIGYNGIGKFANSKIEDLVKWGTGDEHQTLGGWVYDKFHPDSQLAQNLKSPEQKPVDVNANMTVALAPGLVLQNQSMQTSGGHAQMNTGNIHAGAPG